MLRSACRRVVVPAVPRLWRGIGADAAQTLENMARPIPNIFPPPAEPTFQPYMYLPELTSAKSGTRMADLTNIPPPQDPLLTLVASHIMGHGQRAKASRRISRTLLHIFTLTRAPPLPIFREAVLLSSPAVRVSSKTVGAKVVHTPLALSEKQRAHYGIKILLKAQLNRPGKTIEERLAREMVDIVQKMHVAAEAHRMGEKLPGALGEKEEVHRQAMLNRGNIKIKFGGSPVALA